MKFDAKNGALIVLAVLVVAFLAAYAVLRSQPPQGGGQNQAARPAPVPSGPPPSYAPKGQLVPGFPKELILDAAAQVSNSYSINYSASLNQYTAQWNSSSSMAALYAGYKAYLPKNGWQIVNQNTGNVSWRGIYATNGTHDVNVAIVQQGKGSRATVSYVQKQAQ